MNNQFKTTCALIFTIFILVISQVSEVRAQESMRANLYIVPASSARVLVDGNYTQYDNAFSCSVDMNDVWKMTNIGENFGILRSTHTLVMERRKVIGLTDTSFFRLWNLQQRNYQLEIITKNCDHPDLQAFLYDSYTGISNEVNTDGTTVIDFSVNATSASYASNRFKLIYNTVATAVLPIRFTSVSTKKKSSGIVVQWQVENESDVLHYSVERSTNGYSFSELSKMNAFNTGSSRGYSFQDVFPYSGDNYYRIHAIDINGKHYYSAISKVMMVSYVQSVNVFPNPVVDKKLQISINNSAKGQYDISLVNATRNEVYHELIHLTSSEIRTHYLPSSIAPGLYRLMITGPGGFKDVKNIIVL